MGWISSQSRMADTTFMWRSGARHIKVKYKWLISSYKIGKYASKSQLRVKLKVGIEPIFYTVKDACHAKDYMYDLSWGYSFYLSLSSAFCYLVTVGFGVEKYMHRAGLVQKTLATERKKPTSAISELVKTSFFTANQLPWRFKIIPNWKLKIDQF